MNKEIAMNGNGGVRGDIPQAEGVVSQSAVTNAARVRLVELESLVGNLYLAKEIVCQPAAAGQPGYNSK